jgi:hypothetical protein
MFSCSYSNSNSQLGRALIGCGYMFSIGLDGNMYYVGNNGCNPYTSWNGVWPVLALLADLIWE